MNLPSQGLARYGAVSVTTASPGQILLMLYDGLFRFLREAMAAMEAKDSARLADRTNRALAILEQLILGLDRSKFPALCDNLLPLYQFCSKRIVLGNLKKDPTFFADVVRVLTPLREAWVVAVRQVERQSGEPQAAARVAAP